MRTLLFLIASAAAAAPVGAQVLVERFDYSNTLTFPPTGWVEIRAEKAPTEGWESTTVWTVSMNRIGYNAAGHDDYVPGAVNDSWLITPEIDLADTLQPFVSFDESLGYARNLANHPAGVGDGVSQMLASTDGITWTEVWTETRTEGGLFRDLRVPIDYLAGVPNAQIAFRYYGTYAHTWVIDNVVVDDAARACPTLEVMGSCGTYVGIRLDNMTPGGRFQLMWSLEAGSSVIPGGPCAGAFLPLAVPRQIVIGDIKDHTGEVMFKMAAPPDVCGRVQLAGFDVSTCCATNRVAL